MKDSNTGGGGNGYRTKDGKEHTHVTIPSPQSEEWVGKLLVLLFGRIELIKKENNTFLSIESLIKDEIRKAEERGYNECQRDYKTMDKSVQELNETILSVTYNKAISDAVGALPENVEYGPYEREKRDAVNETISEIRASLEALKK